MLELTPDELLSTTRAVRRRLDLERPVEREVLEECLRLAQQAPTGSYRQDWHFVVVTDPELRGGLARAVAARSRDRYLGGAPDLGTLPGMMGRVLGGVRHLYDHLHEVPVHVIPCVEGRTDGKGVVRPGFSLGLDHPGGLELHARRALPRSRDRLDDVPPLRARRRPPSCSGSPTPR